MLKTITASLAALLVATPASAALTQYSNADLLNRGVHPGIVQGFDSLNVPVFNGNSLDICQIADGVRPVAFYNFKHNAVLVCEQNVQNADEFISSVTHEAVHMVQDCRNGLESNTLEAADSEYLKQLFARLPGYLQDNILKVYKPSDYAVEIEAFYFQSRPAAVATGVQSFCF